LQVVARIGVMSISCEPGIEMTAVVGEGGDPGFGVDGQTDHGIGCRTRRLDLRACAEDGRVSFIRWCCA
jgi:hypothetical protein